MDKKSSPNEHFIRPKRKKITQTYLENAGAYYLERFSASVTQFRRVMSQKIERSSKDHPDQNKEECLRLLETVVGKFISLGYLNDQSYAQALLHSLNQRGLSRARIINTLRTKGVDAELIESIMPEPDKEQEKLAALRWAKKKRLGPFVINPRENDTQRGLASLARAGFGYDIANWVICLSPREAEDLYIAQ
jgi:regulatory protein